MSTSNEPRRGGTITLPIGATDDEIDTALRGVETEQPPKAAPQEKI